MFPRLLKKYIFHPYYSKHHTLSLIDGGWTNPTVGDRSPRRRVDGIPASFVLQSRVSQTHQLFRRVYGDTTQRHPRRPQTRDVDFVHDPSKRRSSHERDAKGLTSAPDTDRQDRVRRQSIRLFYPQREFGPRFSNFRVPRRYPTLCTNLDRTHSVPAHPSSIRTRHRFAEYWRNDL